MCVSEAQPLLVIRTNSYQATLASDNRVETRACDETESLAALQRLFNVKLYVATGTGTAPYCERDGSLDRHHYKNLINISQRCKSPFRKDSSLLHLIKQFSGLTKMSRSSCVGSIIPSSSIHADAENDVEHLYIKWALSTVPH